MRTLSFLLPCRQGSRRATQEQKGAPHLTDSQPPTLTRAFPRGRGARLESCTAMNKRDLEPGIKTELDVGSTYGDYLKLPQLLSAQAPRSAEHDELLFIIQHQ